MAKWHLVLKVHLLKGQLQNMKQLWELAHITSLNKKNQSISTQWDKMTQIISPHLELKWWLKEALQDQSEFSNL